MEQEKKCKNCKFFILHYGKIKLKFKPLPYGHCINEETHRNVRKYYYFADNCCEKWESNEELEVERKESIKTVLRNMRTTLNHIENILKDDIT